MNERLQKIMARCGVASRRKCEALITAGRVTVDGKPVTELGVKVDPNTQKIEVDGKVLEPSRTIVLVMNKPRGVICSSKDDQGRKTVIDLVVDFPGVRLYPVGRLDYNTSGVLLITNDGELAHRLTHPRFGAEKKYMVKFRGVVSDRPLDQWRQGVVLDDGIKTRPVIDIARVDESDECTWVHVTIKEGKNRQIRRMADATGLQISKLKRVSFAGIDVEGVPVGMYRLLTPKEIEKLVAQYNLTDKDFINHDRSQKQPIPQKRSRPRKKTAQRSGNVKTTRRPARVARGPVHGSTPTRRKKEPKNGR